MARAQGWSLQFNYEMFSLFAMRHRHQFRQHEIYDSLTVVFPDDWLIDLHVALEQFVMFFQ